MVSTSIAVLKYAPALLLPRHRPAGSGLVDRVRRNLVSGRNQKDGVAVTKRQAPVCRAGQTWQTHWPGRRALPGGARCASVAKRDSGACGLPLAIPTN